MGCDAQLAFPGELSQELFFMAETYTVMSRGEFSGECLGEMPRGKFSGGINSSHGNAQRGECQG